MTYKQLEAPDTEPVTLSEAKLHLRETGTDQDTLITSLIQTAREYVENKTGRALMPQTWDLYLDEFIDDDDIGMGIEQEITIYRPPFSSLVHIKYTDYNGDLQTMDAADYQLDDNSEPARLTPAYGEIWPSTLEILNAVNIRFIAGYQDADSVPAPIKSAMLLIIGHLFENREAVTAGQAIEPPLAVSALLGPYVMKSFY
jgi:uncharacterized phiE125 gp8 family phage protein